jgi:hypothetical protein
MNNKCLKKCYRPQISGDKAAEEILAIKSKGIALVPEEMK